MKKTLIIPAVIVILLVATVVGLRWWQHGTIQQGDLGLEATPKVTSTPEELLINYVDARRIDLNIDSHSHAFISRALENIFVNNPHSNIFNNVSSDAWENKWTSYKAALIEKAKKGGLDTDSLNMGLDKIRMESNKEMPLLPIAAYFAKHGKDDMWIIVCKWGYPDENFGHIRIWAIDRQSLKIIGFARCK